MAKIICPNCGEVDNCYLTEHVRRGLIYDANGSPQGQTEEEVFYVGKAYRCLNCGSKVRIELGSDTDESDAEFMCKVMSKTINKSTDDRNFIGGF